MLTPVTRSRRLGWALTVLALIISALSVATPARADTIGSEAYRPAVHFSPQRNWLNDPNGLIYYHGIYHLFYQYNQYGTTGGNASWGHAISSDLVHWNELPVAIPVDANEEVWSGSVVNDRTNTSGLGANGDGPLVAVYTSATKDGTSEQRQSIAYSNDGGLTWTKYAGNPVINIHSVNFRDPKVFWYAPTASWRMVVVLSDQHKVAIYSSPDLRQWTEESQFGPAGVTTAVWECPDLFPMNVDGNPDNVKWVMTVNVAGGAIYFTGDFDGTTYTSDSTAYTPPTGTLVGDGGFEGSDYGDWTAGGAAFGSGPAHSDNPGNNAVGNGWVDSYGSADSDTGTLTSPTFTITKDHINFLIAGGNHPYVEGGLTGAPAGTSIEDFEGDSLPNWTGTGDFVGITPTKEDLAGRIGAGVLDTCQAGCDAAQGTVTSPAFTVTARYLDLLTAGGDHPLGGSMPTAVAVLVDGNVVGSVSGNNSGAMNWKSIDLDAYQGQQAQVQIVDQSDGSNGWGHIMVDNLVLSDTKAVGWANQTGANLLIGGQVVRSATGAGSPDLDWASWNVANLVGQQAQIQIVDQNSGNDWGHTIADNFAQSDTAAISAAKRAQWIDWGPDFYAAVSYNDAPSGKRIAVGWMNNWNYANDIPESPWRGAMDLPRELNLTRTASGLVLTQHVVDQVDALAGDVSFSDAGGTISGTATLPAAADGQVQRIDLRFTPGSAGTSGITVLGDGTASTKIGYNAADGTLYVDRRTSGNTGFNGSFASVSSAPVALAADGSLSLRVYLDRSSVEVFTADGVRAMSALVFPNPGADKVQLFAAGGTATLGSISVRPLNRSMFLTAFDTTPTPTISGTPATGATLTAVPGTWSPTATSYGYRWQADGVDIAGATGATFVPTSAQLGKRISVTVTGRRSGYEPYPVASAATAPVGNGFSQAPVPTISGTPVFGNTLTAVTGTWSPTPTFSYRWYADGVAITGATGKSYKLPATVIGQRISVEVTGTRSGLTTTTMRSAETDPVTARQFGATPTPTISGNAVFGSTLYSATGSWQTGGVSFSVQWSADGTPITGATRSTYVPTVAVIGKQITVSVTGTKTGYTTVTKTSDPTALVVPATFGATPTPTISGSAVFGATLYSTAGSWQTSGITLTYQWYADGVALSGATKANYVVGLDAIGKRVTVAVTGTKTGYTTVTKTSDPTATVTPATFSATPTPTISGTAKKGSTLSGSRGTWTPTPTFGYQWLANGTPIAGATGTSYKLTAAEVGKRITWSVTGSKPGYTTVTKVSAPTAVVTG